MAEDIYGKEAGETHLEDREESGTWELSQLRGSNFKFLWAEL